MTISREATQAKLDVRAVASAIHKPRQSFTIADRFEEWAARTPDAVFLHYGAQSQSYGEVNARANQLAHAFRELGLGRGDCCALALENRPEFFSCCMAVLKLGATVALINTHIKGTALAHALRITGAKAAIVGAEVLANFADDTVRALEIPLWFCADPDYPAPAELRAGCAVDLAELTAAAPRENPDRALRAGVLGEHTAFFIFTSGTTGLPKAALTSHMRWLSAGECMRVTTRTAPDDVFYCFLPLYHGAAGMSLFATALCVGGSIVLRRKFSAREFWNDVRRYRVTVCQYIGEICRYLLNQPERPDDAGHSVRCMMGAGLSADIWEKFQSRFGIPDIYEGWGSTEANTSVINVDNRPGSCGRVPFWDKTNFRLVRYDVASGAHVRDAEGFMVPCLPGEVGEAIGMIIDHPDIGGGRFEGYTSAEATEQKILRNVFREGDAWWSSGDLMRMDEDGYCYFVDRVGDTFRWKSENVSTQEVAEALSDFPGLEIINVYGVRVPGHEGRAGMATIVMQPGCPFDARAFYALTTQRLPHYAVPLFLRLSAQADLTTTFKLRKVDLHRQGYDPANFSDPLLVRDNDNATYSPYDDAVLARLGLPPFDSAQA
jgi:fatty-acyl-CoA synthase